MLPFYQCLRKIKTFFKALAIRHHNMAWETKKYIWVGFEKIVCEDNSTYSTLQKSDFSLCFKIYHLPTWNIGTFDIYKWVDYE